MIKNLLTIATRESSLALQQAQGVKQALHQIYPDLQIKLLGLTTTGDQHLEVTLSKIGGKGLFVKELEQALLNGDADIAVHSMKDVPMILPPNLCIPVICERENPCDVFVSTAYRTLEAMPGGATVGTSSLRRQTQLKALRPDLSYQNLRGNINTRLARLDHGDFDAIILAAAGLHRMQLSHRITHYILPTELLPAAAQGALGIECREDDTRIKNMIAPLHDVITGACVIAERAVCKVLNGGCQAPVAAYAAVRENELGLQALVASVDGKTILRASGSRALAAAESLGRDIAEDLIAQGALPLLSAFYD